LGDTPPFDRSAMDGFAMRSSDTLKAREDAPVKLNVTGVVYAGGVFEGALGPFQAVRIMTGAAMPNGADCMLPKEIVKLKGDSLLVFAPARPHDNYIFRGEDIHSGDLFLSQGARLDSLSLAMLATTGLGKAQVYRPLNIGVFCVGDEFSPPDTALPPGKIFNSNGIMLTARLKEFGFDPPPFRVLPDDPKMAAAILKSQISDLDVIITAGSVSVGDKDIMHSVFDLLGVDRCVHRLAFKPGSAFLCGGIETSKLTEPNESRESKENQEAKKLKPFFCLSGNPFAALATLELVVRPILANIAHLPHLVPRRAKAVLVSPFSQKQGTRQRRFLRARLTDQPGDLPFLTLPDGHSSGRVFSLAGCNCLVELAPGLAELPVGTVTDVIRLDFPSD
jgi:molybdopterin molybdotransferase